MTCKRAKLMGGMGLLEKKGLNFDSAYWKFQLLLCDMTDDE